MNVFDLLYASREYSLAPLWDLNWKVGARIAAVYFDSRASGVFLQQGESSDFVGAGNASAMETTQRMPSQREPSTAASVSTAPRSASSAATAPTPMTAQQAPRRAAPIASSVTTGPRPAASPGAGGARGTQTIVPQAGEQCRYCNGVLPAGRRITFCPHCGQNLTVVNCLACGTELELGWKFCTTCGRPASVM